MKSKKEITIYDLAKTLKISASTVSRALNDHPSIQDRTKERIKKLAQEMGYQQNAFASNLRRKRSNTIGVIVPRLDSYFMATVIYGLEKELNKAGYNLIISQSQEMLEREKAGISTFFSSRVDGLILSFSSETMDLSHLDVFLEKDIPVVFFDRIFQHEKCTQVVIDNFQAGFEITTHLIEQGCKSIAHFSGNFNCSVYRERFKGYKHALEIHNIPYKDEFVMAYKMDTGSLEHFISEIIDEKLKVDGIFAANDNSAAEIIVRLQESGYRIPEDVAVAGFNNNPISELVNPNLTTINYPGENMGEIAASTILEQIKNPKIKTTNNIVLKHELIVRNSSLKIKNKNAH